MNYCRPSTVDFSSLKFEVSIDEGDKLSEFAELLSTVDRGLWTLSKFAEKITR